MRGPRVTAGGEEALEARTGDAEAVRQVFEDLPIALAGMEGPRHTFVAANAAYRAMAGRPDAVGRSLRDLFPELAGQRIYEMYDRVYATGTPQTAREWRVQMRRGQSGAAEEVYFDFTATPRHGPDGTVTGVTVYAADVTERVRARQAAEREAAEAERRYQAARHVVATLQEALLPKALPVLPGARIAARYLVAGQDLAAGGDWFDALPLPDGRVALVVGDVVGHGVAASAAMGQLRAVLRHVLAVERDLAAVLGQADRFAASDPALREATVCLAVLDPVSGELRYATCGHPAPLVVTLAGTARFLPGSGAGPLGTGSAAVLESATLDPGDVVLLYSDGLIERPGRTMAEGMAELATVAGDAAANRTLPAGSAATAAERVCQLTVELLTRTGYADDVTTLAAQRLPAPAGRLAEELPAEQASVVVIRHALQRWLDRIDPAWADRQTMVLAITEAVANAVEHAYPPGQPGPVRVEAALSADGYLEACVSDQGRWREPDPGTTNRGHGLMLAAQLTGDMQVSHPPEDGDGRDGGGGTAVRLRRRLYRPAMLASRAAGDGANDDAARAALPPFAAELVTGEPVPVVRVSGPVDITTADRLASRLLAACRGGVLPLTVDLTAVTILASAGVRALHQISAQLTAQERELTLLASPGSPAAAVLDLVRLPRTTAPGG